MHPRRVWHHDLFTIDIQSRTIPPLPTHTHPHPHPHPHALPFPRALTRLLYSSCTRRDGFQKIVKRYSGIVDNFEPRNGESQRYFRIFFSRKCFLKVYFLCSSAHAPLVNDATVASAAATAVDTPVAVRVVRGMLDVMVQAVPTAVPTAMPTAVS